MNKFQLHLFLFLKIPISWIAGVRLKVMNDEICVTKVKFGWLNQNPFNSMFWAVQGMAAEFSTGFLCAEKIRKSGKKISMLVVHNQAEFTKKAVGRVTFSCLQGKELDAVLQKAIETGEGQTLTLFSEGKDQKGDVVSKFAFTWSFKVKN
ncbi:thioesterase [Cloacibacterium normanense]|uniref:Thioesterase n=1 Tax=Cloacibacterium normanense TaxID=237258 RepID=A0A2S7I274_9FLAO|nr:DUF4442 domain-containing protein [Cloacibacterium normanense]PPZ90681.1 thioesterase [Cloacibacterium normanense]